MERYPADSSSFVLVAAELFRFPSANVLAVRFRRTEKNPQTDVVGQTEQETQTDSDFRDNTAGKG